MLTQLLTRILPTPSRSFFEEARPPENTPDVCFLEQREYWFVFDHANVIRTPCAFKDAFTDQRFSMWLQNHEVGTPKLVFKDNILAERPTSRARLRGKLHMATSRDIEDLDILLGNRVRSDRKRVRLVLPYYRDPFTQTYDSRRPAITNAWVYFDRTEEWKNKFLFDYELWRGREGTAYVPARTFKDNRPWINWYWVPTVGIKMKQPKCTIGFRDNEQFRIDLKHEEKTFYAELRELNGSREQQHSHSAYPLPQVS